MDTIDKIKNFVGKPVVKYGLMSLLALGGCKNENSSFPTMDNPLEVDLDNDGKKELVWFDELKDRDTYAFVISPGEMLPIESQASVIAVPRKILPLYVSSIDDFFFYDYDKDKDLDLFLVRDEEISYSQNIGNFQFALPSLGSSSNDSIIYSQNDIKKLLPSLDKRGKVYYKKE